MQVVLIIANDIESEFSSILIFVGVFLGSIGAYMTVKMFSMLSLFIYMLAPAITITCFGIALLHTYLGSFPYRNSNNFLAEWKYSAVKEEERMMILACQPIGFKLGLYGNATSMLGVKICDEIIRNTVNMLLLG